VGPGWLMTYGAGTKLTPAAANTVTSNSAQPALLEPDLTDRVGSGDENITISPTSSRS